MGGIPPRPVARTIAVHLAGGHQWMDRWVKMYKMLMERKKEGGSWGDAYTTAPTAMTGRRQPD